MNEFADLVGLALSWQSALGVVVVFSLVPGTVLQLLVKVYPRDHPLRQELLATYAALPKRERLLWVGDQLVWVVFHGLPARVRAIRGRRLPADLPPPVPQPAGTEVSQDVLAAAILSLTATAAAVVTATTTVTASAEATGGAELGRLDAG